MACRCLTSTPRRWTIRARACLSEQLGPNNLSHYDEHGLLAFVVLLDAAKPRYGLAGENLGPRARGWDDTITRIEDRLLMKSPTHSARISSSSAFPRAAIGMARDSQSRIAFAEIFRD